MCQFKSGVAVKINDTEVDVKYLFLEDSHIDICEHFDINDNNLLSRYKAFVELVPSKFDFNDLTCWKLMFEVGVGKPDWWTDSMTEQATRQLIKAAKEDYDAWLQGKEVKRSLCLNGFSKIPDGFILPKVGWGLFLERLTTIPKNFSPVVGGDLYMNGLKAIVDSDEFNPIVGGNVYVGKIEQVPDSVKVNVKGKFILKKKEEKTKKVIGNTP